MSLQAIIKYKTRAPELESSLATAVNLAVQKSLAVLERNIKVNTPTVHGHLKRSISGKMIDKFSGAVFTNPFDGAVEINYAIYVEFGTKHFAPRAMFRKGVAQSEEQIKALFTETAKNLK